MAPLIALVLFSHNPTATGPYDWHMSCDRWQQRAVEIWNDENIPEADRNFLVNYLRGKVEGECEYPGRKLPEGTGLKHPTGGIQ